ncbi:MAG: peptidoglycan editing factor PgeF [Clostridia bacterium]|nr:peptidoglycan editing factor PgeF [Clostridia bacterium]
MKDLSNENIIHVKKDGIEYIQFKRLLEYKDKLTHCYTLRPLNLKNKSKEDTDYIKICNALNLDNKNIVMPNQTHTNKVGIATEDSVSTDFIETDGLVTNVKGKTLSAVFADCTSLFLYDPVVNAIGNIHSGWKGTISKIGESAINLMINEYGSKPENLICCIGPTIRQCHFEVEDDVKELYMNVFEDKSIIKTGEIKDGKRKYYIDSVKAIVEMLLKCGLKRENIVDSGICTMCNSDILHSYRADKERAGRNASIMSLK